MFYKVQQVFSGVGTPNFSEMKASCLTLPKSWLYKNELFIKLLRAPVQVPSKVCHEILRILCLSSMYVFGQLLWQELI